MNERGDGGLVAAAEAVAPLVMKLADVAEQDRRLPPETVEALVAADLMRMGLPEAYGGPEAAPLTMLTAIEVLARADGAAGWCSMIASSTSTAGVLPRAPGGARRSSANRTR